MKIGQIVAQGAAGAAVASYPNAGGAGLGGATAQTLARGAGGLEDAAVRGLDTIANEDRKAAETRSRLEAEKAKIKAETDAAELSGRFEVDLAGLDTDLRRMVTDPKSYLDAYTEASEKLRDDILAGASPEASTILRKKLPGFMAQKKVDAIHHGDKLYVDGREASLVRSLDYRAQLAGLAPLADANEFVRQYREGVASIQASTPIIGEKRAAERLVRFREEMFAERARKHADTDPAGFLDEAEDGSFYQGLDPNRRESLVAGSYRKLEAQAKEVDRQENQARVTLERETREQSEEAERRVIGRYRDGTLTVEHLNDLAELRLISSEKFQQYTKMLDKQTVEGPPASPELLRALRVEVYSSATLRNPKRTEERIVNLIAEGRLPVDAETDKWLSHLQSLTSQAGTQARIEAREGRAEVRAAQAEQNREDAQRRADAQRNHAQAEQLLRETLRVTSPFEALNKEAQTTYARALEELTRRSYGMAGKEDPYAVYQDLKAKYLPQVSAAASARVTAIRKDLGEQVRNVADLAKLRPSLSPEQYYRYAEMLREADGLEQEAARMALEGKAR